MPRLVAAGRAQLSKSLSQQFEASMPSKIKMRHQVDAGIGRGYDHGEHMGVP